MITCRIAAKEYTFERFTEVEMADFDQKQIAIFAENWFRLSDPVKAERFIHKLQDNEPIQELATNPLLLTLLCLVFGESADFPANRSELYKEGLDVLLKKWDAKRNIERDQVYKNLSLHRKEDLLSQIALTSFEQKDYFFKQKTVEAYIADFIRNLRDARTELKELELDSEAVLKAIEAQHGLLVERAKGIYSFSHLTFQEYFTAREIVANSAWENLAAHITEKRWREVFLLTAGMMRNADKLVLLMKREIDNLLAKDEKLQQFLIWLHKKCLSVVSHDELVVIRVFYLCLEFIYNFEFLENDEHIELADYFGIIGIHNHYLIYENSSGLEKAYYDLIAYENYAYFSPDNSIFSDINEILCCENKIELILVINQLKNELPNPNQNKETFQKWWKENRDNWCKQIKLVVSNYRNICHDWQFSEAQQELLLQYYDANVLLMDCLESDCYVSCEVRQEIENSLLLPISELKIKN